MAKMISDWTKKYEPKNFENLVLINRLLPMVEKWKQLGECDQNIMLYGSPGFGKTSMGMVIIKTFNNVDFLYFNAGDVKLEQLQGQIDGFLKRPGLTGKKKILLLDEIDVMGAESKAMNYLKSMIYKYQDVCTVVATTNNVFVLSSAIMSRFPCSLNLVPENEKERKEHMLKFYDRSKYILETENVKFDEKIVKKIIMKNYPDYRLTLGLLQLSYNMYGCIDEQALNTNMSLTTKILQAMKEKNLEEIYKQMKNINAQTFLTDFYNNLYKLLDVKCIPEVIHIIKDYNKITPDKEINVVACINELINSSDVKLIWK